MHFELNFFTTLRIDLMNIKMKYVTCSDLLLTCYCLFFFIAAIVETVLL